MLEEPLQKCRNIKAGEELSVLEEDIELSGGVDLVKS